jgi:hypothetical protein
MTMELSRQLNLTSVDEIILTDVVSGSTVLTGVINVPAGSTNDQTLSLLNSALSSGASLGGIPIQSSEFIASIPISEKQNGNDNTVLIVAIVVPVGASNYLFYFSPHCSCDILCLQESYSS